MKGWSGINTVIQLRTQAGSSDNADAAPVFFGFAAALQPTYDGDNDCFVERLDKYLV